MIYSLKNAQFLVFNFWSITPLNHEEVESLSFRFFKEKSFHFIVLYSIVGLRVGKISIYFYFCRNEIKVEMWNIFLFKILLDIYILSVRARWCLTNNYNFLLTFCFGRIFKQLSNFLLYFLFWEEFLNNYQFFLFTFCFGKNYKIYKTKCKAFFVHFKYFRFSFLFKL